ncbi:hypothetical protein ANCCAN_00321 [Ancylostoma caninum]|uniref:Uncharacterized protein n=1 Tax=Ancylostoma caninum TaxID=29170 RepID=A0A368H9H5_ANCCA|nr:hypothetical protein ANCCAN_00321 [Ancylostoma caninum]
MQPSFGSRSSLATSQARGESSDIDFSWIREEENKLRNERENSKRLPECYFGMDPPKLEDTTNAREREEKENLRRGNVRSTTAAFEQELAKEKREQVGLEIRILHTFGRPSARVFTTTRHGPDGQAATSNAGTVGLVFEMEQLSHEGLLETRDWS